MNMLVKKRIVQDLILYLEREKYVLFAQNFKKAKTKF